MASNQEGSETVSRQVTREGLEARTKNFALRVIRVVGGLPRNVVTDVLGRQLLKSATSIGANYREAGQAESRSDFIHKIGIAAKEASETRYWIELLRESGQGSREAVEALRAEGEELLRILVKSSKTAKRNR